MGNPDVKVGQVIHLLENPAVLDPPASTNVTNHDPKSNNPYVVIDKICGNGTVFWVFKIGIDRDDFRVEKWMNQQCPTHLPFSCGFPANDKDRFNHVQQATIHLMEGNGIPAYSSRLGQTDTWTRFRTQKYINLHPKHPSNYYGTMLETLLHPYKYVDLDHVYEVPLEMLDHCPNHNNQRPTLCLASSDINLVKRYAGSVIHEKSKVSKALLNAEFSYATKAGWCSVYWFNPTSLDQARREALDCKEVDAGFVLIVCLDNDDKDYVYVVTVHELESQQPQKSQLTPTQSKGTQNLTRIEFCEDSKYDPRYQGYDRDKITKLVDFNLCYLVPLDCLKIVPDCLPFAHLRMTDVGEQQVRDCANAAVRKVVSFKLQDVDTDASSTIGSEDQLSDHTHTLNEGSNATESEMIGSEQDFAPVKKASTASRDQGDRLGKLDVQDLNQVSGADLGPPSIALSSNSTSAESDQQNSSSSQVSQKPEAVPSWTVGLATAQDPDNTRRDYPETVQSDASYENDWSASEVDSVSQHWNDGDYSDEDELY